MNKLIDIIVGLILIGIVILIFAILDMRNTLDKVASSKQISCNLPPGTIDKIDGIYNNLDTERVNREIEVICK